MKIRLAAFTFILSIFQAFSQSCFDIESILVDACGTPEGQNEMVRLQIGPNALNTADITVSWPNNNYLGICQNATTAGHVSAMNSTVLSCGYFLEPSSGVLPAGAEVLMITSTDFDPTSHNYAGLTDTIYVIFQCAGNTNGHFANWTNPCDPATGDRTLTIDIGVCNETVTYNKCSLLNQTGGIGGTAAERDGARVDFDPTGDPSYANDGCTIPYTLSTLSANFTVGNGVLCLGDTEDVGSTTTGNFSVIFWNSNNGTFSDSLSQFTTYLPSNTQDHYIYLMGVNGCNDTIRDSLLIQPFAPPTVTIQENTLSPDCVPGSIELVASGATTYLWSTAETNPTILPSQSGTYTVYGTNVCGTDSASVDVVFGTSTTCFIDLGNTFISCDESIVATAITNGNDILWNTGDTSMSITITQTGNYWYTASGSCGACGDTVFVEFPELDAFFTPNTNTAYIDEIFDFFNLTLQADQYAWYIDGEYITNSLNFAATFSEAGQYTITLEATNSSTGCSDTYSIVVTVIDDYSITIPNIITPNEDGSNDVFGIQLNQELRINAFILNRWGNIMEVKNFQSNPSGYSVIWDGWIDGEPASEGVYFYKIIVNLPEGPKEYHGHFQLVR